MHHHLRIARGRVRRVHRACPAFHPSPSSEGLLEGLARLRAELARAVALRKPALAAVDTAQDKRARGALLVLCTSQLALGQVALDVVLPVGQERRLDGVRAAGQHVNIRRHVREGQLRNAVAALALAFDIAAHVLVLEPVVPHDVCRLVRDPDAVVVPAVALREV